MQERSVSLGFIHSGTVRTEFMVSVMNVISHPLIGNISNSSAGPLIALARNNLAARFLQRSQEEWLWCVDTDIVFSRDCIDQLMAVADSVERPIVSAVYHILVPNDGEETSSSRNIAAAFYQEHPDLDNTFPTPEFRKNELVKVGGTGGGCILVHRSVFERIYKDSDESQSWYNEMILNGKWVGEDLSFCLRARESGFPIYVHTGIKVGHVKSVMLGEISMLSQREGERLL